MRQQKERLRTLRRALPFAEYSRKFGFFHIPMASEEMVSFYRLVPDALVLLAPDALPVRCEIFGEQMLGQLFRVGEDVVGTVWSPKPVSESLKIVVAGDEELDWAAIHSAEHITPYLGVKLKFPYVTPVGHVAAVDYGIRALFLEILERRAEIVRRRRELLARHVAAQMGVADKPEYEPRIVRTHPPLWSRKHAPSAAERTNGRKCAKLLQEISSRQFHPASFLR